MRTFAVLAAVFTLLVCAVPAHAYPTAWVSEARCIHFEETRSGWSKGWHLTTVYGTGVVSRQRGGMQIDETTWASFAPTWWPRDPARASRAEQLLVAWRIWRANGRRWGGGQWPQSAKACGVS